MSSKEFNPDFGDYCLIEQKRFNTDNEMFLYKVIAGNMKANYWTPVPVTNAIGRKDKEHGEICEVVKAIQCGVIEEKVQTFRLEDIKPSQHNNKSRTGNFNIDNQVEL